MYTPIFVTLLAVLTSANECPDGSPVYALGISEKGKSEVVDAHNRFRWMIANEQIPGQPRGINLMKLSYDDLLGEEGRLVSARCQMKHVIPIDNRFQVGQNLYREKSSMNDPYTQNWEAAVETWFNEHENFIYPNQQITSGPIGHYKQVVWAETTLIGCDFIAFYDRNDPQTPYTKLYTCNYGIGLSNSYRAPYKTGTSGCENLC